MLSKYQTEVYRVKPLHIPSLPSSKIVFLITYSFVWIYNFKTISSAINSRYTAVYISASSIYFISIEQDKNIHNTHFNIFLNFVSYFAAFPFLLSIQCIRPLKASISCKFKWGMTIIRLFYSQCFQNHL